MFIQQINAVQDIRKWNPNKADAISVVLAVYIVKVASAEEAFIARLLMVI